MIPINVDFNVTKNDFGEDLLVTSVFYTLQGEGRFTGQRFIFIRLAGCNFGSKTQTCVQCDTAFQIAKAQHYTVQQLFDHVLQLAQSVNCHNIVLTGGEPTLQLNILDFMNMWIAQYPHALIQIETNGSQPQFFMDPRFTSLYLMNYHKELGFGNIYVCCSPKCNEQTGRYSELHRKVWPYVNCLKLLVSADPSNVYHKVPDYVDNALCDVYISPITVYKKAPEGEVSSIWDHDLIDEVETARNYAFAAEVVMHPALIGLHCELQLSLQTHLFTAIA